MYVKYFRTCERSFCGVHDHTGMDIEQPQITCVVDLNPEHCKQALEGRALTLFHHKLFFRKSKMETHHKWKRIVIGSYIKECKGYERITKEIFESHIQDITLKVRFEDGKIFNRNDQLLP